MTWSPSVALAACLVLVSCSSQTTVRGVVTQVDGDLTTVHSFTLRTDGGDTLHLSTAPDGVYDFALVHLRDHLRSSEPVVVGYETRNGSTVAVAISDG